MHTVTAYDSVKIYFQSFLTSVWEGGEWSASSTGRFTSGIHEIWGWVGPITGVDVL